MDHCGACGNTCNAGQYCGNGECITRAGLDLTPSDQGWRSATATHRPSNQYLAVGRVGTSLYRGFIIFDPANLANAPVRGNVTRVALRITQDLYASEDNTETITVHAFGGDLTALTSEGVNQAVFDALGTGTVLGSGSIREATNSRFLEINMNDAGIALVRAAQAPFALGLTMSVDNQGSRELSRFGTSTNGTWLRINGGP